MAYEAKPEYQESKIVAQLAGHIQNPCSCDDGNIRQFYIQEARELLPHLKNPLAKSFLETVLSTHES